MMTLTRSTLLATSQRFGFDAGKTFKSFFFVGTVIDFYFGVDLISVISVQAFFT